MNLKGREVMVDENSETPNRNNQELHPKTVMVPIVGSPELHVDQINCGIRTADVYHLVSSRDELISDCTRRRMQPRCD